MAKEINMLGVIYGKLRVVNRFDAEDNRNSKWVVQCECGEQYVIVGQSIRTGKAAKSCKSCRYYEYVNGEKSRSKNKVD